MRINAYHIKLRFHSSEVSLAVLCDRARLDYRRLEGHLKFCAYCVLEVSIYLSIKDCATNVFKTLDSITPLFYNAFEDKYAGSVCTLAWQEILLYCMLTNLISFEVQLDIKGDGTTFVFYTGLPHNIYLVHVSMVTAMIYLP